MEEDRGMMTTEDIESLEYYNKFNDNGIPHNELAAYSQWVEGKILTKGRERQIA